MSDNDVQNLRQEMAEGFRRVHERIDITKEALSDKIGEAISLTHEQAAMCKMCGKVVLGNGLPPLNERMSVVEAAVRNDHGERIKALEHSLSSVTGNVMTVKYETWLGISRQVWLGAAGFAGAVISSVGTWLAMKFSK